MHWVPPHPDGDKHKIPCTHPVREHPGGDRITGPCTHPMTPVLIEHGGALVFYTDNADLQSFTHDGISRLKKLGVDILATGPLNIFNRAPINGNPNDNEDPFWSHYESLNHAIQITNNLTGTAMRDVLFHEMGHALVGHSSVQIPSPGGPHDGAEADPALALAEGWAQFVGAVMLQSRSATNPVFKGSNLEVQSETPSHRREFHVAKCLWDLYDSNADGNDNSSIPFLELIKVFQPTFPTLVSGPLIADIFDFCKRLGKNNPSKKSFIDRVREQNVGS